MRPTIRQRIGRIVALAFPYLCGLLVLVAIVADGSFFAAGFDSVQAGTATYLDPVCGMEVGEGIHAEHQGGTYRFCTEGCRERFVADPDRFLNPSNSRHQTAARLDEHKCPICGMDGVDSIALEYHGVRYTFCHESCREAFQKSPEEFLPSAAATEVDAAPKPPKMHTMAGLPAPLYYGSIVLILLLSFVIIERAKPEAEEAARVRVDLLHASWFRRIWRARYARTIAQLPVVVLFLLIIAAGLFGDQIPGRNIAPLLTWTIWWGGLVVLVMYGGKIWCYVCPWDALAGWIARDKPGKPSLSLGLRWPRAMRTIWPATFLFILLTWIELGLGVTMNPRATAYLALLMLGMAIVAALIFERKAFCRYACLIGRISGLYALFAPVEVRAGDRDQCRICPTNSCYKGSESGLACPTHQHLGSMQQNTYCINCLECVKTCEFGNVSLNLRPWGADLATHRKPRSDEAYLALVMLSLTAFHGLTMTGAWTRFLDWLGGYLPLGQTAVFSIGMLIVGLAPIAVYALLIELSRRFAGIDTARYRSYFIRYAYALLPIALFYHLAHNSEHLFMEGPKVIALLSDPLGAGWNLFGTADWSVPPLMRLSTLWVVQIGLVAIGHIYSLWIAHRAARALFADPRLARRSQYPMLIAMILFSLLSLWLLKQPMEMRSSAM